MSERPTWQHISECPRCVAYRPNLNRTLATAAIVGSVLFLLNHLYSVIGGHADGATWVETAVSFIVPFCVANLGVLIASRRPASPRHPSRGPAHAHRGDSPTWERLREWPSCILHRPHLRRTVTVALIVGTVYFLINQFSVVLAGHATTAVWAASGATYLVPFSVSNFGVLIGSRREVRTQP